MKTWTQIIQHVQKQKIERKWQKLYWAIDMHDTIITGTYNRFNDGAVIYPYAKETLDYLFNSPDHYTILWTSSYMTSIQDVVQRFDLNFNGINCNPECPNTTLCDFQSKFYFNFVLDDKAGFDGTKDWREIYEALTNTDKVYSTKQKRIMEDSLS
jgi:hypothetical protein